MSRITNTAPTANLKSQEESPTPAEDLVTPKI